MPTDGDTPIVQDDDVEDTDSCLCGMEHLEEEETSDEELPSASGGVSSTAEPALVEDEHDVDGCELDFTAVEETNDIELPAAVGGT